MIKLSKEDLTAYSSFVTDGFMDELDKISEELANASEEIEQSNVADNVENGVEKPIVDIETSVGPSSSVTEKMKQLVEQVRNVRNQSTNGPTKGENITATQLAGDVNVDTAQSQKGTTAINTAESDTEKEASDRAALTNFILSRLS